MQPKHPEGSAQGHGEVHRQGQGQEGHGHGGSHLEHGGDGHGQGGGGDVHEAQLQRKFEEQRRIREAEIAAHHQERLRQQRGGGQEGHHPGQQQQHGGHDEHREEHGATGAGQHAAAHQGNQQHQESHPGQAVHQDTHQQQQQEHQDGPRIPGHDEGPKVPLHSGDDGPKVPGHEVGEGAHGAQAAGVATDSSGTAAAAKEKAPCDGDLCDAKGHGHGTPMAEGNTHGSHGGAAGIQAGVMGSHPDAGAAGIATAAGVAGAGGAAGDVAGGGAVELKEASEEQVKVRAGWEKWHADIIRERGSLSEKETQDYQGYLRWRANLRFPDDPPPLPQETHTGAGAGGGGVQSQRRRLLQVEESEGGSLGGEEGEEGMGAGGRRLLQASGEEGHEGGHGSEQHEASAPPTVRCRAMALRLQHCFSTRGNRRWPLLREGHHPPGWHHAGSPGGLGSRVLK